MAFNSARRSPETGPPSFVMRAGRDLEGIVSKRIGFTVREWPDKGVVEDQEPGFERR